MKLYIILSPQGFTDVIKNKLKDYYSMDLDEVIICSTHFHTHMFKSTKDDLSNTLNFKKLTITNLFNFYQGKSIESTEHISSSKNFIDSLNHSNYFCYKYENRTDILNSKNEVICKEYIRDNQVIIRDFFKNKQFILKEKLDEFNYVSYKQYMSTKNKKVLMRQFLNYQGQVVIQKNYTDNKLILIDLPLEGKSFTTESNFRQYWYKQLTFDPRYINNIVCDESSMIWKEISKYIYPDPVLNSLIHENTDYLPEIVSNDSNKIIIDVQSN